MPLLHELTRRTTLSTIVAIAVVGTSLTMFFMGRDVPETLGFAFLAVIYTLWPNRGQPKTS